MNKQNKTLFIGGPLDGKKEYIKEDFKSQKYFIQKCERYTGRYDHFDFPVLCPPKVAYYYPKKICVAGMHGDVKEFMFMVNNPYITEIELMEKLISGHRSMKK